MTAKKELIIDYEFVEQYLDGEGFSNDQIKEITERLIYFIHKDMGEQLNYVIEVMMGLDD